MSDTDNLVDEIKRQLSDINIGLNRIHNNIILYREAVKNSHNLGAMVLDIKDITLMSTCIRLILEDLSVAEKKYHEPNS